MSWFDEAVIYEIYPQSFADGNGDGIGDLPGVIHHLDHLAWLGVNTIWFNPCLASPFRDAGYDVSDYLQIAPRRAGGKGDPARSPWFGGRQTFSDLCVTVSACTSKVDRYASTRPQMRGILWRWTSRHRPQRPPPATAHIGC